MLKKLETTSTLFQGVALMLTAIFMFSIMDAIAKGLTERYPASMVVWARYASQTLLAFVILAPWLHRLLITKYIGLQILRSALLFGGTIFFFTSFSRIPLTAATAVFQLGPLIITALSVFILKETVGLRRWAGVGAGLVGAIIIIRPGSDVFNWYAVLPCAAAFCYAGYTIATRFLGNEESHWTSFLYTAIIGTIVASCFMPFVWQPIEQSGDYIRMLSLGAVGAIGHLAIILALTRVQASVLAPFGYFSILFNSVWGYLFYAETPDIWTVAGALVIVGAGLYVWHRRQKAQSS